MKRNLDFDALFQSDKINMDRFDFVRSFVAASFLLIFYWMVSGFAAGAKLSESGRYC
jgi:hypothetical protein